MYQNLVRELSRPIETDTIRDIKLAQQGKKPVKKIDFVSGEERVEILHNPIRLLILQILRDGIDDTLTEESFDKDTQVLLTKQQKVKRQVMSVFEIIRLSEKGPNKALTKNQIYHHLPLLEKGGFIVKHGVVTKGKRTTDYYRRTAENFVTYGLHYDPNKYSSAIKKEVEDAIPFFDFSLSNDDKKELAELLIDAEVMRLKWAPMIESLVIDDIAENRPIEMCDKLLWIYSIGQDGFLQILNEIYSLVFKDE